MFFFVNVVVSYIAPRQSGWKMNEILLLQLLLLWLFSLLYRKKNKFYFLLKLTCMKPFYSNIIRSNCSQNCSIQENIKGNRMFNCMFFCWNSPLKLRHRFILFDGKGARIQEYLLSFTKFHEIRKHEKLRRE